MSVTPRIKWITLKKVVHEGPVVEDLGDFNSRTLKFYCLVCGKYHVFRVEYYEELGVERKVLIKNVEVKKNE